MASRSKSIKNALVTLMEGLELGGEPAFTKVRGHPRGQFDSYPSARVLPADQSTDKAAIGQNDRSTNFTIRTHLESTSEGTEFDHMYDLTDLIIDALDTADFEDGLNGLDPTINSYILNATRGDWFDEDSQAGTLLSCDVNVEVKYSKDN